MKKLALGVVGVGRIGKVQVDNCRRDAQEQTRSLKGGKSVARIREGFHIVIWTTDDDWRGVQLFPAPSMWLGLGGGHRLTPIVEGSAKPEDAIRVTRNQVFGLSRVFGQIVQF